MMAYYVLGFMIDRETQSVALIQKTHPKWQEGKLNGIGGKVRKQEYSIDAMVRECTEETGENTGPRDWSCFAHIEGKGWRLWCFVCEGRLSHVRTRTDESIVILPISEVINERSKCVSDVPWLLLLAMDYLENDKINIAIIERKD